MAKKRKDGRYQLRFNYEGKTYYVYGKTKTEAEAKKYERMKLLEAGDVSRTDPTMEEYYKKWSDNRKGKVSENTIRNQKLHFKRCASIQIGNKTFSELKLKEVNSDDIECLQTGLKQKNITTRGINDTIHHLSHVFNTAIKADLITKNPCKAVENLKRTEPEARETKHRALTQEETAAFFEEAEKSYYLNAFRLLIQTGMRCGELGALYLSDIDQVNNCIHITKTITRDEIGNYIVGDTTKTKSGKRDIPLTDTTKAILRAQRDFNREIFGNVVKMTAEPLFRTPEGLLMRDYSLNREIKRICERARIQKFTAHAFRATFATRFIEQRPQDYKVLSEILGHSSTKITLDLYTHVMTDKKENAMQQLVIEM